MDKIRYIADHYGKEKQLDMLIEECAELIQAISKYNRGKSFNCVAEEIADVEIMIEQIKYLFLCGEDVAKIKEQKIDRQIKRIEEVME